ncbi:unnamed protein product [Alopecurus aequalis]
MGPCHSRHHQGHRTAACARPPPARIRQSNARAFTQSCTGPKQSRAHAGSALPDLDVAVCSCSVLLLTRPRPLADAVSLQGRGRSQLTPGPVHHCYRVTTLTVWLGARGSRYSALLRRRRCKVAMGLAGGIVRRVLSKSPCSSAGGNSERSPGDHKRRWGSLRLYLCGDESGGAAAADDDDDEDGTVVSAGSFEACAVIQIPLARQGSDVDGGVQDSSSGCPEELRRRVQGDHGLPTEPVGEEEAAALIQSEFRRFMARRRLLQEMLIRSSGQEGLEPKSPASASIAASVEVQVGESLSNLRLSDDGGGSSPTPSAQHRASHKSRPQVFRAKEWDDSTLSSNVLRMRIQSRMEATTRRERALAYAFSQQLRSGGGTKKRSSRSEQGDFNVGWSWLERWMATRQAEPAADDCASKNATDAGSAVAGRRVVVAVRRRQDVAAVEEKESCGSNDVSAAVSFDGSSAGGRSGLSCYRPGKNNRLRGARNLPRRKVAAASSDHGLQARSHKVSKKARQRDEKQLQKDRQQAEADADAYDPRQPPTDY